MSETDISKMNFKELRNEVLLLRDELYCLVIYFSVNQRGKSKFDLLTRATLIKESRGNTLSEPVTTIPDHRQGVAPLLIHGLFLGNEDKVMRKSRPRVI